jgi:hypothetical protein
MARPMASAICGTIAFPSSPNLIRLQLSVAPLQSHAIGVGNNPEPVAPVRRVNGASWNNKRPDGEAFSFQRCGNLVETEFKMSSNILGNDPSRPDFSYKSMHLRPEMSFIFCAELFSGDAEGLAGVSAANKVNCSLVGASVELPDVAVDGDVGPMLVQDGLAEGIDFAEGESPHARLSEAETESPNAGEEVEDIHASLSAEKITKFHGRRRSGD